MNWNTYPYFALAALACWSLASVLAFHGKSRKASLVLASTGLGILALFIGGMWIELQRPPLATLGETRLWYSFFLLFFGLLVSCLYCYRWIPALSTLLSLVFSLRNLIDPAIHTQALQPVLNSFWFVPHVITYIFAYGLLAVTFLLSVYHLLFPQRKALETQAHIDRLSGIGSAFLLLGICLGIVWAKQAWGNFWAWDPKETWALATLLCYGIALGLRHCPEVPALSVKGSLVFQILGFLCLQICWYGINYLPSAQGSLHAY